MHSWLAKTLRSESAWIWISRSCHSTSGRVWTAEVVTSAPQAGGKTPAFYCGLSSDVSDPAR